MTTAETLTTLCTIVQAVFTRLPGAESITKLEMPSPDAVRFNWHGKTYRVDRGLHVEEVQGAMLASTSETVLMGHILRRPSN